MTPTKQTNIHYYYYFKPKARHQTNKDFPNNIKLVVLTAMGKCPLLTSNTDMHGPQIVYLPHYHIIQAEGGGIHH